MSLLKPLFRAEWLTLTRSGLFGWLVGLLLLAGGCALFYGKTEIRRQHATTALLHQDEQARLDTLRRHFSLDTTIAGNRQNWQDAHDPYFADVEGYRYAIDYPRPLAALSLGQRDLQATYQPVASRSLLRQLDATELANPQKLLAEHFDLNFVLVSLLPLLIIALGYNVLSSEQEHSTLALLRSQPVSVAWVLGVKLLFRLLVVLGAVVTLTLLAGLLNAVPLAESGAALLGWFGVAATYAAFWFGVVALVVAFGQSSAFNAVALLGAWILLVPVAPTLTQLALDRAQPLPDRAGVLQAIRQEYGTNCPKAETLQLFYETHPDLKGSDTTSPGFSLMVYYACNALVDQNLAPLVAEREQRLLDREATVRAFRGLLPAVNAQDLFNRLAGTDEASHRAYFAQIAAFHRRLTAFFVTKKFRNQSISAADYEQIPG